MENRAEQVGARSQEPLRILDDAWDELRRSPFMQRQSGVPITALPDLSLEEAQRRSAVGASLLERLAAVDLSLLPHDLSLSLRAVRFRAHVWSRQADWYGTVIDPLGVGFFGPFLPTAYCGGMLLNTVNSQLAEFAIANRDDVGRYLSLVADYARLIDQFAARTAEQAARGMRMPKVQVSQARLLLQGFKASARTVVCAPVLRAPDDARAGFARELKGLVESCVEPAFDRLLEGLSDRYMRSAPDCVGLSQYAGGAEVYAELVRFHTTMDLTPQQVHAEGHSRLSEIQEQKRAIRTELGFDDDAVFVAHLNQDPRWRADSVEGVAAVFRRYVDRMTPRLCELFPVLPKASFRVAPLPQALAGSMTFGYFDPPRQGHAEGVYLFNAANLTKQALYMLGSTTYHELMPGHHLQVALQFENETLHPFRQYSLVTAYNEGWAEYAATLAGEIGLYEQPEERYGRLVNDARLTSRLVVDTGMNALGWSLEQARDFMRGLGALNETEIRSETLRYSCDIPGQALAYKIGDRKIMRLRELMRSAMGAHFDLRTFHASVLQPGALPLPDLQWHVEHCTREATEGRRSP